MRPRGVLVLDLDGTVATGDEPVYAYADAAAAHLPPETAAGLRVALRRYLAGDAGRPIADAPDGYSAVAALARDAGVADADLGAAFRTSRERLHRGEIRVSAPPALAELLDDVRPAVHVVLASNAPGDGIPAILRAVGVAGVVDEVHGDLGKPAGLERLAADLLDRFGWRSEPGRMLAVGDIWINDLAPVAALGGRTAFIDARGTGAGRPDARGDAFSDLVPAVRDWAASLPPA